MSRPKTLPHSPGVTPGEVWRVAAEQKPHVLARRYKGHGRDEGKMYTHPLQAYVS